MASRYALPLRAILALLLLSLPLAARAQQGVGIGTTSPHPTAALDVSSNDKGVLVPRLTAARRAAIAGPAPGLLVYQTDAAAGFYYFDGTRWHPLTAGLPPNSDGTAPFSVTPALPLVSTLAGSGTQGFANGLGTAAQFNAPSSVAVDAAGVVYVADYYNHRIRKILPDGTVSTLAGSGTAGFADGPGTAAQFNYPRGVAVDAAGVVYVADLSNQRIRKVQPDGTVSTLAGSGAGGFADGPGTAAQFYFPKGVAVDAAGVVYVADEYSHRIRKVQPDGTVSTLAGSGAAGFADGPGTAAQFNYPTGVAVDAAGVVYVADASNHRIRKVQPNGTVSTLAGSGAGGFADGPGTAARFSYPYGVAVDAAGVVYVADASNHRIRRVQPNGTVSTLAGSGTAGFADGPGTAARFNAPTSVAVDAASVVYVADPDNHRIRKIVAQGTQPLVGNQQLSLSGQTLSLTNGGSVTLPSDNLGNHTATQHLALSSHTLRLRAATDDAHGLRYDASPDGPQLFGNGGGQLGIWSGTDVTPVLHWTNAGRVGIGTSTPRAGLHVDRPEAGGTTTAKGVLASGGSAGNANIELRGGTPYLDFAETNGDYTTRLISATSLLNVLGAGRNGILLNVQGGLQCVGFSNISDQRLKQHVRPLTGALAGVRALRGVRYEWNAEGVRRGGQAGAGQVGVLAQEVERVYPELVVTGPDGYKAVNYAQLAPVLIEALKEQQVQIEALQQRAATAEAQAAQATAATRALDQRLRALEAAGATSRRE